VDYIAPGHCTGEPTFAAPQRMFGERYLYAGLGATLSVGAVPRAESPGSAALNKDDLRSYRKLVASSDDLKNSAPTTVRLVQVQ
jgi:7,8-dihydropterin-6-yl-methyl-4-(beta-D-ribofuranosyl)aminobenzene 5'-phosphate synthase